MGSLALHRFQPSTNLPPYFFNCRLCLEDFCLIHELEFQTQSQLEHAYFLMSACPDEVACLERFRRVLRHDEFGEQIKDGVFDALAKREAPPFVQILGDIDNLLVEIVSSVDDWQRVH